MKVNISESAIEMQPKRRLSHFGVYLAISLAVYLAVSFYFYVYWTVGHVNASCSSQAMGLFANNNYSSINLRNHLDNEN